MKDLLTWISFINRASGRLDTPSALIHGAFLVLLDGLALGAGIDEDNAKNLREQCFAFLVEELKVADGAGSESCKSKMESYGWGNSVNYAASLFSSEAYGEQFGIDPFYISKGSKDRKLEEFLFLAPTTCRNALRVLRAMQLREPVLLEGSPRAGKPSLVAALAECSGHVVVRINLSEQTDMMGLFASGLPFEGGNDMEFCWSDGILLQAIKNGSWVLLDELNLAPQSVLEGLNSILDHRADIFIPQLGQTFKCPDSFRVFACLNTSSQGDGRKGLPNSFLNHFTKVYVDEFASEDYLSICKSCHAKIPAELLSKLITFNRELYEDTMIRQKYGREGSPWEFNLRDVIRSCKILEGATENAKVDSFLSTVYLQRMRTTDDREKVLKLFEDVFGVKPFISQSPKLHIDPQYLTVGSASVGRNYFQPTKTLNMELSILPGISHSLEAALHCVQEGWLCILVGPRSSGKSSLVRLLAQLTGNALNELSLSSGTDISELIGCFGQYNFYQNWKYIVSQVERYINEYFSLCLESSGMNILSDRKSLFTQWLSFLSTINLNYSSTASLYEESWRRKACNTMVEIITLLKHDLEELPIPESWSNKDLNKTLKILQDLQRSEVPSSAKFEWVTSDLIKAIECGEWVILDNANLCNPMVLDRITSLVDPEGSITINECGLVDGKPMVLHAHPKFRMFITVGPEHGEVSRAIRDRGIEIYMMHENWLPPSEGYHDCQDAGLFLSADANISKGSSRTLLVREMQLKELLNIDGKRFLIHSGIPGSKLVEAMSKAHVYARAFGTYLGVRITLLELARWVQLFKLLVMNGNRPTWSLQLSFEHTYFSSLGGTEGRDMIDRYLTDYELFDPHLEISLSMPGGWPVPQSVRDFACYSREACVRRNCLYLEFLSTQFASYEVAQGSMETSQSNTVTAFPPSLVPRNILHHLLLPNTPEKQSLRSSGLTKFNSASASQILYIAANWTIEQANESDLILYIQWFKWHASQLRPYCSCFENVLSILEQISVHRTFTCILDCRKKIVGSDGFLKYQERLDHVTNCLHLLFLTYKQWHTEKNHELISENSFYLPFFESLRTLEEKALGEIVESQEISQLYSNLLEHHILLWKRICSGCFREQMKSSNYDSTVLRQKICPFLIVEQGTDCYSTLSVSFTLLKKAAVKLRSSISVPLDRLLEQHLKLKEKKAVLWSCGCRPLLPSIEIYNTSQFILDCCDENLPCVYSTYKDNCKVEDIVLSASRDVRKVAMEGLSDSVVLVCQITSKGANADAENDCCQKLQKIYSKIWSQFSDRRKQVRKKVATYNRPADVPCASSLGCSRPPCCVFSSDVLFCQAGIGCWIETLPLFDIKSISMDIKLLKELSRSTVNSIEAYQVLSDSSPLLRHTLDYSMEALSRSPVDFAPHLKIMWILDNWDSVDSAHQMLVSFVLEMWYKWHSSLWKFCTQTFKPSQSTGGYDHFMRLSRIATPNKLLHQCFPIEEYDVHCLKLRAVSRILWEDTADFLIELHSAVYFLFRQIIFVHSKFFEENAFNEIISIISQPMEEGINTEQLEKLREHISSSSHYVLSSSSELICIIVEALPKGEDLKCPSYVTVLNLGCVWLHIGILRFHLLLNHEDPDPAMMYILKQRHIEEKISSLQLEIKVRQDCVHIAGRSSVTGYEKQKRSLLQKLEEKKKIRRKVVVRPEPSKYKSLVSICADFQKSISFCTRWLNNLKCDQDPLKLADEACNWQADSESFINRLSKEYAEYIDIIQPVQVAIYEMKLGLSIALSSSLERKSLEKVKRDMIEKISSTIYSLVQFPRSLAVRRSPRELTEAIRVHVASGINQSGSICALDVNFVKELITMSSDSHRDDLISLAIHRINLIDVAHNVCNSQFMEQESFLILEDAFDHCARLWSDMEVKDDEEHKDHYYKFRPHTITIEDIFEQDFCPVHKSDLKGILASSCEEDLEKEVFTAVNQCCPENGNLEGGWNGPLESILRSIVLVHSQLFERSAFVECPGDPHISYEIRTSSFMDAYKLGAGVMIGGRLFSLRFSSLNDTLVLEHLLHMCLEYEKVLAFPHQRAHSCNIYKGSNADMVKMAKPLIAIQERVNSLLCGSDDHPDLKKILSLIRMLLAFPYCTPLSKALDWLQVLVSKVQILQNSVSRFSFSDQLHPLYELVSFWQRWGVECWPLLIERVEELHDTSAESMWFRMYAVIHRTEGAEASSTSTVLSVAEIIESSSLGEFKKRLHLLLSFYGRLYQGACLKVYPSSVLENLKGLYNIFGYYVRFMPLVLEHIADYKRCIENELEECQKLFHLSQGLNGSSVSNFQQARVKIRELVQSYNDFLQKPVLPILFGESRTDKLPSWLEKKISDIIDMEVFAKQIQINDAQRFSWYSDWKNRAISTLESMFSSDTAGVDIKQDKEFAARLRDYLLSGSSDKNIKAVWQKDWKSLEKICGNTVVFAQSWNAESKNDAKGMFLETLLNNLERCGLSRCRSELDLQDDLRSSFFLQPSYDVRHLHLKEGRRSSDNVQNSAYSSDLKWETANDDYFKSLAILQQLWGFNFNKDLSTEQVNRAISFLFHLINIQQDQRNLLYKASDELIKLRQMAFNIGIGCDASVTANRLDFLDRMWYQKQLFDGLLAMSKDVYQIHQRIKTSHLSYCDKANIDAGMIQILFEFAPIFEKSKGSLNKYLFGCDGTINTSVSCMPFVATEKMKQLLTDNLKVISDFEKEIQSLYSQNYSLLSAKEVLLNRFKELIIWYKEKDELITRENGRIDCVSKLENDDQSILEEDIFMKSKELIEDVSDILLKCHYYAGDMSAGNITEWKGVFQAYKDDLHLDAICNALRNIIIAAVKLLALDPNRKTEVEVCLKQLHEFLKLLLEFGQGILSECLDVHEMVAAMNHVLGLVFASLFSKGFDGGEDTADDSPCTKPQDASGTGMGEGEGVNDSERANC